MSDRIVIGGVSMPASMAKMFEKEIKEYNEKEHIDPTEKLLLEKLADPTCQAPHIRSFLEEELEKVRSENKKN